MSVTVHDRKECLICSNMTFLYKLECQHEYCMSCVKRIYADVNLRKCPACTFSISKKHYSRIVDKPESILTIGNLAGLVQSYPYVWIYKGRNIGWWIFDLEFQDAIENAYAQGAKTTTVSICGNQLILHFEKMQQFNKNGAVREIKRVTHEQLKTLLIKGLGGMK